MMASRGNGLFTRFGGLVPVGNPDILTHRFPVDIQVADFIGDGSRAAVIINRGRGGVAGADGLAYPWQNSGGGKEPS